MMKDNEYGDSYFSDDITVIHHDSYYVYVCAHFIVVYIYIYTR